MTQAARSTALSPAFRTATDQGCVDAEEPLETIGDELHGIDVGSAGALVTAKEREVARTLEGRAIAEGTREASRILEAEIHSLPRERVHSVRRIPDENRAG